MADPDERPDPDLLSKAEVRQRASAGIFYIASSGFTGVVIGFVSNLLLARMLTPRDFGLVAVGATVATFSGALVEGGLGSGMIRRAESPTRPDLRALNGIQLAIALAICVPTIAVALQFGLVGAITAIMVVSLPIVTLQTPGRVLLIRQMKYERQAIVDLSALATSQAFSIAAVALGAGVWGLATGTVARTVVGTVMMGSVGPGVYLPSFKGWRRLGGVMRFGLSFQSNWIVIVFGDQGLNATVGSISGVHALGLWSLAKKTLLVPSLLFNSLAGVVFPAVSNLLAHGDDPARTVLRTVRLSAIAATLVFVPFVAASPELIPFLFGAQWSKAADVIPLVVLAALIEGPVSAGIDGYLFALGRPGPVLRASAANAFLMIVVTAPLLSTLGVTAIGIGALCGGIAQALVLDRTIRRVANIHPIRSVLAPVAAGCLAGGMGLAISHARPHSFSFAVLAGTAGLALDLVLLMLLCREDLSDSLRFGVASIRDAAARLQTRSP